MTDEQKADFAVTLDEGGFALKYHGWAQGEDGVIRVRPKTSTSVRLLDEFGDMINFYERLYELGIDDPSETLFIRDAAISSIREVMGPNGYGVRPEQFTWKIIEGGVVVSRNNLNMMTK